MPFDIFPLVFGAFVAGLLLMGMHHEQLDAYAAGWRVTEVEIMVFNGGPASVFCSFPSRDQTNLWYLLLWIVIL